MSDGVAVIVGALAAFALKLAGYLVPGRLLSAPTVVAVLRLLPVALLAALVSVQTLATDGVLTLDARAAGVAAAITALLLRAPFLVVIAVAAAVAAGLRASGAAT